VHHPRASARPCHRGLRHRVCAADPARRRLCPRCRRALPGRPAVDRDAGDREGHRRARSGLDPVLLRRAARLGGQRRAHPGPARPLRLPHLWAHRQKGHIPHSVVHRSQRDRALSGPAGQNGLTARGWWPEQSTCGYVRAMTLPHEDVDPDGLLEYSVVFTDRSLNHMSKKFVSVMQDINRILRSAYDAEATAIVPGGGSYAMESVARQIATGKKMLIVRTVLFSLRWSQILAGGDIAAETTVLQASADSDVPQSTWSPAPIAEVVAAIEREKPDVVFTPHVETASGMLLPDDYVK